MKWDKHGLIIKTPARSTTKITHAMVPSPVRLKNGDIRLYFNQLDHFNQSSPTFADVCGDDPSKIKFLNSVPLLSTAVNGCFDDSGVQACSFLSLPNDIVYMYYSGYEICEKIPYRIMTGLAISSDAGRTFVRYRDTPILDRINDELFVRGGPCCIHDNGIFRMWYVAGSQWINIKNVGQKPSYSIHYLESKDGLNWTSKPEKHLIADTYSWYALGRPYVFKISPNSYKMIYSQRHIKDGSYHMNLASSDDGYKWSYNHHKNNLGIETSTSHFENKSVQYGSFFRGKDKVYCFYNGNDYGLDGVAFATSDLINFF